MAEHISISTVAARHRDTFNTGAEDDDAESRSEAQQDVWNHAVHARGASFGFNIPFTPNNDRYDCI